MAGRIVDVNINKIKHYISKRSPYLLIDKATEIIPAVSAKGYKNLSVNEWFFSGHFPGEPIVPGMIQMEALFQMLSLTVLTLDHNAGLPIQGISANKIRFKKKVIPGCRLDIEAKLDVWDGNIAIGGATGSINGEEVCSGEFKFTIIKDIKELY